MFHRTITIMIKECKPDYKTGVIPRKHYASYLASLHELTSLKIDEESYTGAFFLLQTLVM